MRQLKSLISSAKRGDAEAQCRLAAIAATGSGTPQDEAQAIYWYRLAAKQDHPEATFNLAMMYWNGEGTNRSESRARQLLEKAAKLGSVDAHEYLAELKLSTKSVGPEQAALHLIHAIVAGSSRAAALLADWLRGERISIEAMAKALSLLAKSQRRGSFRAIRRAK